MDGSYSLSLQQEFRSPPYSPVHQRTASPGNCFNVGNWIEAAVCVVLELFTTPCLLNKLLFVVHKETEKVLLSTLCCSGRWMGLFIADLQPHKPEQKSKIIYKNPVLNCTELCPLIIQNFNVYSVHCSKLSQRVHYQSTTNQSSSVY